MDYGCVGISHPWYRSGKLVGILRARLGGLVVLESVENASLIISAGATALMHSLAVTEKRGLFRSWTLLLAIAAFSLSLLGTFLVRSGVLTSVHAFVMTQERGVFILGFLVVIIGGSLTLYAVRASKVSEPGEFGWISRVFFCYLIILY